MNNEGDSSPIEIPLKRLDKERSRERLTEYICRVGTDQGNG